MKQRVTPESREKAKDNAAKLGQHICPTDQMFGHITHAMRTRADDKGHPPHQNHISVGRRSVHDLAADYCGPDLPPPLSDASFWSHQPPPMATKSWTVSW